MNYYIITEEIFNTLTKDNISFCLKNIDNTKRLISTTSTINVTIENFENINTCSQYTFNNSSDWVGDGTGVTVEEIESTPYIFNLDP